VLIRSMVRRYSSSFPNRRLQSLHEGTVIKLEGNGFA
jgi:hypothetical protein